MRKLLHRLTAWSLITALTLQPVLAQAQTIVVQGSDNGIRPRVDTSLGGHPVLNISTPNSAGVSHDIYTAFTANDLIVNNSPVNTNTQLSGFIEGNPNLRPGAEARTWIGEVVGGNQTQLNGILEVAGSSLDMVLANEFGITCNGCGFFNTNRTTLTTGKPVFNADGSLKGFDVKRGLVTIGAGGLNPQDRLALGDTSRVDVIARAAALYGQMRASEANIITGANVVDYNWSYDPSTGLASGITPQAGTGAIPALAVDVSALGGMYAGAIKLIATEAGVGVRLNGEMASSSSIALSSSGRLSLGAPAAGHVPKIKAKRKVRVRATGPILLEGSVVSELGDQVEIRSIASGLTVKGEVSGGAVTLESAGLAHIEAAVTAQSALSITSQNDAIVIAAASEILAGSVTSNSATSTQVDGIVSTVANVSLTAETDLQIGASGKVGGAALLLKGRGIEVSGLASARDVLELDAGVDGALLVGQVVGSSTNIRSAGSIQVSGQVAGVTELSMEAASSLTTSNMARVFSKKVSLKGSQLEIAGVLTAQDDLLLESTGGNLNTAAALSGANITLRSGSELTNTGTVDASLSASLSASGTINNSTSGAIGGANISLIADVIANSGLTLSSATTAMTARVGAIANTGRIIAGTELDLNAAQGVLNSGLIKAAKLDLVSSVDLAFGASSQIVADDLDITARSLSNAGLLYGSVDLDLSTTTGALQNSGTVAGADVSLKAATDLTNSGTLQSSGQIVLEAAQALTQSTTGKTIGNSISAKGKDISLAGAMQSTTSLNVIAGTDGFRSEADLKAAALSVTSTGDAAFDGVAEITGLADVTATGAITTTAGSGFYADKIAFEGGSLSLEGEMIVQSDLNLTSTDAATLSGVVVGKTTTLTSGGALDLTGVLFGNEVLNIDVVGAATLAASSVVFSADLDLDAASISSAGTVLGTSIDFATQSGALMMSGLLIGEEVSLVSATDLNSAGQIAGLTTMALSAAETLSAASTSELAGGLVNLSGGDVNLAGLATSDTALNVNSTNGNLTTAAGLIGANVALNSTGTIAQNGIVNATTLASIAAQSAVSIGMGAGVTSKDIKISGASVSNAGLIVSSAATELTATTGAINNTSQISAGSTLTLNSNQALANSGLLLADALDLTSTTALEFGASSQIVATDLGITAPSLVNAGLINGKTDLDLTTATGALTNSGEIVGSDVSVVTATEFTNSGDVQSSGNLNITAGGALSSTSSGNLIGQVVTAQGASLSNAGIVNAVNANLSATGSMTHTGTTYVSGVAHLSGGTVNIGGTVRGNDLRIDGTQVTTGASSVLEAARDTLLIASSDLTMNGQTRSIGTFDARVTAGNAVLNGTLNADISKVDVSGQLSLGAASQLIGQSSISVAANSLAGGLDVSDFTKLKTNGNLQLSLATGGMTIAAGQQLERSGNLALSLGGAITNAGTIKSSGNLELWSGGSILNAQGKILSGGAMALSATAGSITNRSGSIEAGTGLVVETGSFVNEYNSTTTTSATAGEVAVNYAAYERVECARYQESASGSTGVCLEYNNIPVPARSLNLTGVAASDLPPTTCSEIYGNTTEVRTCNNLGLKIHDDMLRKHSLGTGNVIVDVFDTGTMSWGSGTSIETSGNRPEILSGGSITIAAASASNDLGLISSGANVGIATSGTFTNTGFSSSLSNQSADFTTSYARQSETIGASNHFHLNITNVTSTPASSGPTKADVIAGGNISISNQGAQNGNLAAGSSATVAPRNSTSVTATTLPALSLSVTAPTQTGLGTLPSVGSLTGLSAAIANVVGVSAPSTAKTKSVQDASGANITLPTNPAAIIANAASGGLLPVIARPELLDSELVDTLIEQGATRLGAGRSSLVSAEQYLTSNYMMDVDRLQYRDELLFNRQDQLPFGPDTFSEADERLTQQSYNALIASEPEAVVRGPRSTFFEGANFGFTQDGEITLAALTQERGIGNLDVRGQAITSAGGSFSASGDIKLEANLHLAFADATITGRKVSLTAGTDLLLAGTALTATDSVALKATEGALTLATLSPLFESNKGDLSKEAGTRLNKITSTVITAGGDFSAIAGTDLRLAATKIDAKGGLKLEATGNVELAFAAQTEGTSRDSGNTSRSNFKRKAIATSLTSGGDMVIKAGKDAALYGTEIESNGTLNLTATNITLDAAQEIASTSESTKSGGFFFSKEERTTTTSTTYSATKIKSVGDANIVAGTNLTTLGAQVDAGGNAKLEATSGKLLAGVYTDTETTNVFKSTAILGGLLGDTSEIVTNTETETATEARATLNLKTVSGGDTELVGTNLEAGGSLNVNSAANLIVKAAVTNIDTKRNETNNGLFVTKTTKEESNRDTAAYAQFKSGTGLSFDVTGETLVSLYSSADNARPDAKPLLPAELLAIQGITFLDVDLADTYFYDEKQKLSPAFKALVSIAIGNFVAPGIVGAVLPNATGWIASAAKAFTTSFLVESLDGVVSGDFDLGKILEGAAFSGISAGLTAGININFPPNHPFNNNIINGFGSGQFTASGLLNAGLDGVISSGLSSAAYGTDFGDGVLASIVSYVADGVAGAAIEEVADVFGHDTFSIEKLVAKAVINCIAAEAKGADCASGALGSFVTELFTAPLQGQAVTPDDIVRLKNNVLIASSLAGFFTSGGKAENVYATNDAATLDLENNWVWFAIRAGAFAWTVYEVIDAADNLLEDMDRVLADGVITADEAADIQQAAAAAGITVLIEMTAGKVVKGLKVVEIAGDFSVSTAKALGLDDRLARLNDKFRTFARGESGSVGRRAPNTGLTATQRQGILREASQLGQGNLTLTGRATRAEAAELGEAWVGPGYRTASDGRTLVSADGTRTFRPPTAKPNSSFSETGVQINFETRELIDGRWTVRSNAHLDVSD